MVQNALKSVLRANENYNDWELAFIDDSSFVPGRSICEEILGDHIDKVRFYNTDMTPEEKLKTGGMVGREMNQAIADSDADIAIMLCDDDELHPQYLKKLNEWFSSHDEDVCFSHVIPYNPIFELSEFVPQKPCEFNHMGSIEAFAQLDASQVAWRISVSARFAENRTKCLDANFYQQLGTIPYSGFISQYKGLHVAQLGEWECEDLWAGRTIDTPDGELLTPVDIIYSIIKDYIDLGLKEPARLIGEKAIELHPAESGFYMVLSELY